MVDTTTPDVMVGDRVRLRFGSVGTVIDTCDTEAKVRTVSGVCFYAPIETLRHAPATVAKDY